MNDRDMFLDFKKLITKTKNKKIKQATTTYCEFFIQSEDELVKMFKVKGAKFFVTKYRQVILDSLLYDDFKKVIKNNPDLSYFKKIINSANHSVSFFNVCLSPKSKLNYSAFVHIKDNKMQFSPYISLPHGHHRHKDEFGSWFQQYNNPSFFGEGTTLEAQDINHQNIEKVLKAIYSGIKQNYVFKSDKVKEIIDDKQDNLSILSKISHIMNNRNKEKEFYLFNEKSLIMAYMFEKIQAKFKGNSFVSLFDNEDCLSLTVSTSFKENGEPLYFSMRGQKHNNILINRIFNYYFTDIKITDNKITILFNNGNHEKFKMIRKDLDLNDKNINNIAEIFLEHLQQICASEVAKNEFNRYYSEITHFIKEKMKETGFNNDNIEFVTPQFEKISYNQIMNQRFPLIIKYEDSIISNKSFDFKKIDFRSLQIEIEKAILMLNINYSALEPVIKKRM